MISIILPVFNAEKYIEESIKSILNQKFKNFELIIINDGSIDSSLKIIKSFKDERIRLIDRENKGLSFSLNQGIMLSKYELIARFDSDDICLPNRFYIQIKQFENNQKLVLSGGNALEIDEYGDFICERNVPTLEKHIREKLPFTSFIHPTVMFRKSAAMKTNLYPEDINRGEDAIFFNSLSKLGQISNVNEFLIKYRVHKNALTDRNKKNQEIIDEIIIEYTKNGQLTQHSLTKFESLEKMEKSDKDFNYHRYLALQYCIKNKKFKKSIYNLILALKIKKSFFKELIFVPILLLIPRPLQTIILGNYKRIIGVR